ncbi:hypothetical protein [Flammeovirga kamogawensis]|uniref:CBM-cenC domain-containing protein n=1 Tax=Flammeovirga kamogawensis TaxID=373891 RepID=A0ABX8GS32_9BACT|nr:hypothetical protein [Flammeovirga kamogawensis]MBB6463169.1 hypothetical protein [Flammeovirga kamogawensis]QWG05977.1 hypothetical protein KM029_11420 [Flammeovirga kamogawensis]TRX67804.1 hypothetical protein EO216_06430 [Flammeovirga kamogawensis]
MTISYYRFIFLYIFLLAFTFSGHSQNLIPNSSFENYIEETRGHAYLDNISDWYNTNQVQPKSLYGTPDHMFINEKQPLKGIKDNFKPRTGKSVLGLITYMQRVVNYREYASVELTTPLKKGENYQFTVYITNGNNVAYGGIASNGFGVYFSENKVRQYIYEPLNVTPQYQIEDILYTTKWTPISFTFTATENSRFLTIGNFRDDKHLDFKYINYDIDPQCYIYLDDLNLIHIPKGDIPEEKVTEVVEEEIIVKEEIKVEPKVTPSLPEKKAYVYEERPTETQSSIYITSYDITLNIWDDKTVDGDVVSIFWNGEPIIEEYELTARKKKLKIRYETGKENKLILYAHNLGKDPPNTMAVQIKAGKKKRSLSIRSDLGKCGAIRFKR